MLRAMATRTNPIHEAARLTTWQLAEAGREIRLARVTAGRTQAAVARSVGTSAPQISRVERGLVPSVTFRQLSRIAGAVGLRLYLRAFPAGRRLLDQAQLDLFAELRRRSHAAWQWKSEVPMPIAGDLRAADALATRPGCRVLVELWTRLADWQAQSRSALLKQRDLGTDRLVIVLKATRANREAPRQAGPAALASFPIGPRALLRALAEGRDPGGNGVVLL
jgi:transcriptional regulator with XRE-family HTH domain